jgi:single-stranded-DNA-specific exonuclease
LAGLQSLEPCGQDNPQPLFACCGVKVAARRCVGNGGRHLKLEVAADGGRWDCIGFGMATAADWLRAGQRIDVCFTPEMDEYMGTRQMQLRLEAVRPGT